MGGNGTLVLWARHGQNEANLSRQFSYLRLDLDLTTVGRAQAERLAGALAERLRELPRPPALFASPVRRAQQTAAIVAKQMGGDVEILDELREVNVGDLDGRGDPEAWKIYESVLDDWRRGDHDRRFPGGENWHELCARIAAALSHIAIEARRRPAVAVAHGANLRAALPGLAGGEGPGVDLGTGQFAVLEVGVATAADHNVRLLEWRTNAAH